VNGWIDRGNSSTERVRKRGRREMCDVSSFIFLLSSLLSFFRMTEEERRIAVLTFV